jgi:hypothetical protein
MRLEPLKNKAFFVGVLAWKHHGCIPRLEILHGYTTGSQLREVRASLHRHATKSFHLLGIGALGAIGGFVHQNVVQQALKDLIAFVSYCSKPGTSSGRHRGDVCAHDDTHWAPRAEQGGVLGELR